MQIYRCRASVCLLSSFHSPTTMPLPRPVRGQQEANGRRTRAPYTQRACIACKRRKQRCSGHDPCKHCENRGVSCQYSSRDGPGPGGQVAPECLRTVTRYFPTLQTLLPFSLLTLAPVKSRLSVHWLSPCGPSYSPPSPRRYPPNPTGRPRQSLRFQKSHERSEVQSDGG